MSEVLQIVKRAREIISAPGAWTQNAFARRVDGSRVDPTSEGACKFCAVGALAKAHLEIKMKTISQDLMEASNFVGMCIPGATQTWRLSLASYNDDPDRTQEEVIAVFDRAIERASANV